MADTRRQKIINAVTTQLQTIKKANSYETDLGLRVKFQKDTANNPLQAGESPCLIVELADAEMEPIAFAAEMHGLELTLKGSSKIDTNIQDKMRADIILAMHNNNDHTWGSLADDTRHVDTGEFDEEHGEFKYLGVEINYLIEYQTANGDPYNLPS